MFKRLTWMAIMVCLAGLLGVQTRVDAQGAWRIKLQSASTAEVTGLDDLPGVQFTAYFTLVDPQDEVDSGLKIAKAEIELADGTRQAAQSSEASGPWEIVYVIDASKTYYENWKEQQNLKTVLTALAQAGGPEGAKFSVISFAETSTALLKSVGAEAAAGKLKLSSTAIVPTYKQACVYDALQGALDVLKTNDPYNTTRHAVILFTASPNCDETKALSTYQTVIADAQKTGHTQIHIVGLETYPVDEDHLAAVAEQTGGSFKLAPKDQTGPAFKKIMTMLTGERKVQTILYPQAGEQTTRLYIYLSEETAGEETAALISEPIKFVSAKTYKSPPSISTIVIESHYKRLRLLLTATSVDLISRIRIRVIGKENGEVLKELDLDVPKQDGEGTFDIPLDNLKLETEYSFVIQVTTTTDRTFERLQEFAYKPPVAQIALTPKSTPSIAQPEFLLAVKTSNLEGDANYKYWLASEKLDDDIGGTTQEISPTNALHIPVKKLTAGKTYRLFLVVLDDEGDEITRTIFPLVYTAPSVGDWLSFIIDKVAQNVVLVAVLMLFAMVAFGVVVWLLFPRFSPGVKYVGLVTHEGGKKGRSVQPLPPPLPAARPAPVASSPRAPTPAGVTPPAPPAGVVSPPTMMVSRQAAPPVAAAHPPVAPPSAAGGRPPVAPPAAVEIAPPTIVVGPAEVIQSAREPNARLKVQRVPPQVSVPAVIEIAHTPFTIGRVGSDLTITDARVSRQHAVIFFEQGRFYIQDKGSANGTWVSGRRIEPHQKTALAAGVVVGLGAEILFKFEL